VENFDAAIELKLYYDTMPRICVVSDAARNIMEETTQEIEKKNSSGGHILAK